MGLNHGIERARLPTEGIIYNISFTRVLVDVQIVILDKLYPSSLSHVQLSLGENIFQALMIHVDITAVSH